MPYILNNNTHCVRCKPTPAGQIFCHVCGKAKTPGQFYPGRKLGYFLSGCKVCRRKQASEYQARTYVRVGDR